MKQLRVLAVTRASYKELRGGGREKVQRFHLVTSKESKEGESKGGREQGRMRVRESATPSPHNIDSVYCVFARSAAIC